MSIPRSTPLGKSSQYKSFWYKFIQSWCKYFRLLGFKNEEYSLQMFFLFTRKLYLKWLKFVVVYGMALRNLIKLFKNQLSYVLASLQCESSLNFIQLLRVVITPSVTPESTSH